jgi:hypothetical protein
MPPRKKVTEVPCEMATTAGATAAACATTAMTPIVKNEPIYLTQNGKQVQYVPLTIVTGRDAYAASLHVLFQHIATFHLQVIELIAEKYNLDSEDIIKSVQEDPRFQELNNNPVIQSMGYFDRDGNCEHLAAGGGSSNDEPATVAVAEEVQPVALLDAQPVALLDAQPVALLDAQPVVTQPPPKKRIALKKKTIPAQ